MLAEAEAGKIGTIIVKDMSRFGRNYLEVGFYTEILFPKKQIRFVAINNSVDSDKPQDNDFTPFLNIMNEWYAKDTSNKIKSIFLSRMSDGKRCSGSIPYGYNRLPEDKQTLVVDPVASQVVKHIFEFAAEGLTPPAIARQLTEEKVLIPSAYTLQYHPEQCNRKAEYGCTSWNANTVREILSRQEYLGHTVLRKTIGTNFKTDERRFATDEERLLFEDTHEPIVDGELWEQAHRRLKHATRRIKEGTHQEECLLPGLVTEAGFTGFERGVLGSTAENLSSLDYQIQKDKERLADIQERIEAEQVRYEPAHEVHKTMAEIEGMGQKTLTGKIAVSKDDYQQLTALAKEGITSRSEIQDLKSSVSYYQKQYFNASSAVERLQERYDRLKEKCQPFLQALEHFPKLVEVFVEKVKELFSIKEAQERKEREDRAAARKEQSKHRRGRNDWER